jgi:hypothetical protein
MSSAVGPVWIIVVRLHLRLGSGDAGDPGEIAQVDVAERKRHLQREREQRKRA